MQKKSAGILLYRFSNAELQVLIVHPGGPFWRNKDEGAWSIPKGEFETEAPLEAALREFKEETGATLSGAFIELTPVKMKSGKVIFAFAHQADLDVNTISSNTFIVEWPPQSDKFQQFPEVDAASWANYATCSKKLNPALLPLVDELTAMLNQSDAIRY